MANATWGRSLATTTAPAGPVGDESIPRAAQPPGLVPSELPRAGCPINPRPRNMPEFRAACAVALGAPVKEYPACQVMPGMQVYHNGRFLEVTQTLREPHHFPVHVELWLEGHGIVSARVADLEAPLYCLA